MKVSESQRMIRILSEIMFEGGWNSSSGGGGKQLFVSNLPFSIQWQTLKDLFRQHGNVEYADVSVDQSGRSKGFGVVSDKEDAFLKPGLDT